MNSLIPANLRRILARLLVLAFLGLTFAGHAQTSPRPLFVFDNGLGGLKTPEEQAALLKELGYDGICTRPAHATPELFMAPDKTGLKVHASYVMLAAEKDASVPEEVAAHIRRLEGRGTMIWLSLTNPKADDETAARWIRDVCDLAQASGLEVVLYPHVGFCTDTIEKCARLADRADKKNLGLSFTLCHFLALKDEKEIESTLRAHGQRLKLVQINGADAIPPGKPDWGRLIQPLGEGSLDVGRVLRCLDAIGYQGPVNLQCYQIKRPAREHLALSMAAWRKLHTNPSEK